MINIAGKQVFLACGSTDMRRGTNGLTAIIEGSFNLGLFDGALFVFCNRNRDLIKVVEWDADGFWLHTKRLQKGKYRWPSLEGDEVTMQLTGEELAYLLGGTRVELKIKRASITERRVI